MSGADLTADDIANGVFHVLYPECPAFPGIPNYCDTQICDCFNADQLPAKVAGLITAGHELYRLLRYGTACEVNVTNALNTWDASSPPPAPPVEF